MLRTRVYSGNTLLDFDESYGFQNTLGCMITASIIAYGFRLPVSSTYCFLLAQGKCSGTNDGFTCVRCENSVRHPILLNLCPDRVLLSACVAPDAAIPKALDATHLMQNN